MALSDYFPSMQGWTPVTEKAPTANQQPQIPNDQTQRSGYLRTTLPLPLQYSGDTIKQYNTPGMSSYRIAPLPPSGLPTVNAAAAGSAQIATQQALATIKIALDMPTEFIVSGSPSGPIGTFDVTWKKEPAGTALMGPILGIIPGVPQVDDVNSATGLLNTSDTADINVKVDDTNIWIFAAGVQDGGITYTGNNVTLAQFSTGLVFAGLTSIGPAGLHLESIAPGQPFGNVVISFFTTGVPTLAQADAVTSVQQSGTGIVFMTDNLQNALTEGNTYIAILAMDDPHNINPITISDDSNLDWVLVGKVDGSDSTFGCYVWIVSSIPAGVPANNNVKVQMSSANSANFGNAGTKFGIMEVTHLANTTRDAVPTFRRIVGTDLPFPGPDKGGVFPFTPVLHEFLTGLGTDGILTAAQPDFTDLSGNIATSQMNNGTNASATTAFFGGNSGAGQWLAPNAAITQRTITANDTVATSDFIIYCNSSSAITLTLLAQTGWIRVKNINTGVVTLSLSGKTIDGQTSIQLALQNQSVDLAYDGSNFQIL